MTATARRPETDTSADPVRSRTGSSSLPYLVTDIDRLSRAAKIFARLPSGRALIGGLALGLLARVGLGLFGPASLAFGRHDMAALAFVVVSTGSFEWFIHKFVLHAPLDSFRTRVLNTSTAHRRHHEDPTILDNVVLGAEHVMLYQAQLLVFSLLWGVPLAWLAGWPIPAVVATGTVASWLALANYEWVHLAVHTRHRFRNRIFARLQRNHRLHHYRNENYWLGVTSNSGDFLARTLPTDKRSVPLSDTARSLA